MYTFQKTQFDFIAHIKDPEANSVPTGIEDRRMKIYRELFFNNVLEFLNNGFPVLKSLYSDPNWQALARNFFSTHQSHSPYFVDISQEFLTYLSDEHQSTENDPPFITELAHYEWVELAVSIAKQEPIVEQTNDDSMSGIRLSRAAKVLSYDFPVHQISPENQPQEPSAEPNFLVVYRDSNDEVHFNEINAVTAHLLSLTEKQPVAIETLLQQMVSALPQLDEDQVIQGAQQIIAQMLEQQIVYPCQS